MPESKKRNYKVFIGFAVLMLALGASDSLRGIFAAIFQEHFKLTASGISKIIMVSYIGNLVFLLVGGNLMDRFERKPTMLCVIMLWMAALILFALTDDYRMLLVGMFVAMGASTLLNTTINIVTPTLFATSPGLAVSVLFFIQGIGTSGGQSLIGNHITGFETWKMVNILLLVLGILALGIILCSNIPDVRERTEGKTADRKKGALKDPILWMLVLIFGLYFIAEHGMMNWFVLYSVEHMGIATGKASNYLALFFGGITLGRLLFAPLIDRLGTFRSIRIFGFLAVLLYAAGILLGSQFVWMMSISGIFFSILYPTLVMCIAKLYSGNMVSTVAGMIISFASLFDIGFNYVFGRVAERVGYGTSFLIMPISMVLFVVIFIAFSKKQEKIR
ncbi:MAG: MFS transporter [Hungatella sp.]